MAKSKRKEPAVVVGAVGPSDDLVVAFNVRLTKTLVDFLDASASGGAVVESRNQHILRLLGACRACKLAIDQMRGGGGSVDFDAVVHGVGLSFLLSSGLAADLTKFSGIEYQPAKIEGE